MRQEALKGGELGEGRPDGAADPDESVRPDKAVDGHRVLAHEDLTLAAERLTDLVHLVAADIVDRDDEDRGWRESAKVRRRDPRTVLLHQRPELLEVLGLGLTSATHLGGG